VSPVLSSFACGSAPVSSDPLGRYAMRIKSTLAIAILLAGCMSVAGRIRPIWAPTWSTMASEPGVTKSTSNVQVRAYLDRRGQTLPGAEVTAVPVGARAKTFPWSARPSYTNSSGVAQLTLPAGEWEIRCELVGLRSMRRRLLVESGRLYLIDFFTVSSETTVISETVLTPRWSGVRAATLLA
jgi:hypothetical protein